MNPEFFLAAFFGRSEHFMGIEIKETTENGNGKVPRLLGWHTYASVFAAMVILAILLSFVDLKEVWEQVKSCNKWLLLVASLCHYATYPIRGVRWQRCLLRFPLKAGPGKFGLIVFFYNFLDNIVPAKLGDLYGAHLVRINCGIQRSAALGALVFIRTLDAWIIFGLATLTAFLLFADQLPPSILWGLMSGGAIAFAASSFVLICFLLKKRLPQWFPNKLKAMIHSFNAALWPRPTELIPIAVLTTLIWTLEISWSFFLFKAFGIELSLVQAVFISMLPLIATAFPLTPSGTGAVELTLVACARAIGVSLSMAGTITVVNRLIDHWLHIGLGLLLWAFRRVVGLRTWREVPFENRQADLSKGDYRQEAVHAG